MYPNHRKDVLKSNEWENKIFGMLLKKRIFESNMSVYVLAKSLKPTFCIVIYFFYYRWIRDSKFDIQCGRTEFNQFQRWIKHLREKCFLLYIRKINEIFRNIAQNISNQTDSKLNHHQTKSIPQKAKTNWGPKQFSDNNKSSHNRNTKKKTAANKFGIGGTLVWIRIGFRSASERCAFLCVINDRGKGQKLLLRVICLLFSLQAFLAACLFRLTWPLCIHICFGVLLSSCYYAGLIFLRYNFSECCLSFTLYLQLLALFHFG